MNSWMFVVILALALAVGQAAFAQTDWSEIDADHFTLYAQGTHGHDCAATDVLNRLEAARSFLLHTPWAEGVPASRVIVLAFASGAEYAPYRISPVALAYHRRVRNSDYLILQQLSGIPERAPVHEYAHSVFSHLFPNTPPWLTEGLAEVYSSTVSEQGSLTFGAIVQEHQNTLLAYDFNRAKPMFTLSGADVRKLDLHSLWQFYAISWAATHMMLLDARYAYRFRGFLDALIQTGSMERALQLIYSENLDIFVRRLDEYVHESKWRTFAERVSAVKANVRYAGAPAPVRVQAVLADLVLPGAEQLTLESHLRALALKPTSDPTADEALGFLAIRSGRITDARTHFLVAISKQATDPEVLLALSEIEERSGRNEDALALLQQAVAMDPTNHNARLRLSLLATRTGRYSMAIEVLATMNIAAISREQRFEILYMLMYCCLKMGDIERARSLAQDAQRTAYNSDQSARAARLLRHADLVSSER